MSETLTELRGETHHVMQPVLTRGAFALVAFSWLPFMSDVIDQDAGGSTGSIERG